MVCGNLEVEEDQFAVAQRKQGRAAHELGVKGTADVDGITS